MIMPGIGQALATIIYISGNAKTLVKSQTKTSKVFCTVWFKKYRSLEKSDLKQKDI